VSRSFFAIAIAIAAAGCAAPSGEPAKTASAMAAAPAQPACEPPPKDLVVKDVEPGKGDPVVVRSALVVGYTGWLYDGCAPDRKGKKFDSSDSRNAPLGFMLGIGRVVKGWDEGLVGMREQGKRTLIIPPDKGYGEKGSPDGSVPPNATLVFDVTLVGVPYRAGGPVTSAPVQPPK
jgi:FKBP-type peptidyl-prolyl cis-trans isomerase